ncbi:MAG TPA: hypothetical protein VGM90_29115 [Kofleriaceae bacterium]
MRGLLLIVIAGATGCATDECERGRQECVDDHTIRNCIGDRDGHAVTYVWREEACTGFNPYCVTTASATVQPGICASSPDRTDACASGNYCAAGVSYHCLDGYAVSYQSCTNGCAASGPDCAP